MAKKMLIDATQPEETRVAVINGNRLDELDFEIASRKQLKGNIYLAKVTRVEPSLQAAFVDYGGNRHGFLAFAEIHPDYYKIPVADREKLLELEREEAEREAAEEEAELAAQAEADARAARAESSFEDQANPNEGATLAADVLLPLTASDDDRSSPVSDLSPESTSQSAALTAYAHTSAEVTAPVGTDIPLLPEDAGQSDTALAASLTDDPLALVSPEQMSGDMDNGIDGDPAAAAAPQPPSAEEGEEDADRRKRARRRANILRQYKIQEVIKKNQIMLIQVVKEERGNKGAALTTYLSLAGRYCVLMPNTNRGGGVSRKINSLEERRRMKQLLAELDLPQGMSTILRTAGLERSKADIKRDLEYLTRLWDSIRERTVNSTAPSLIHEEANLIRRAIRDLYSREVTEVQVEGDIGYRTAKDFMRMMVPSAARRVHHYRDPAVPLFVRHRVESQIEALYSTTVGLKSGGYIVINQTEALVAIDVNSGRSTRERNIEETALRTNLEAADEVARQLRLRDLAGLVVVDFIDMEDSRHNAQVERRMREAMKNDRARIQIGRISMFGLLELSRQRLRPSLIESNFSICTACGGVGHVRSIESAALHVLRAIEEEGLQQKASELAVTVAEPVALYLLNHKRAALGDIERRYGIKVFVHSDTEIVKNSEHKIERLKLRQPGEFQFPEPPPPIVDPEDLLIDPSEEDSLPEDDSSGSEDTSDTMEGDSSGSDDEGEGRQGRGRRGRGGRNNGRNRGRGERPERTANALPAVAEPGAPQPEVMALDENGAPIELQPDNLPMPDDERGYIAMTVHGTAEGGESANRDQGDRRRRRGRRGGRGRFRDRDDRGPRDAGAEGQPPMGDMDTPAPMMSEGQAMAEMPAPDGTMPQPEGDESAQRMRRPRRDRGPRRDRDARDRGPQNRDSADRPLREDRPYRERPERDRSERDRSEREPRLQSTPPGGSSSGSSGGIRIISEFRGRNDPPPAHQLAPVAPPSTPTPAPTVVNVGSADSTPTPDKPKGGWWKRLMG